MKRYQDFDSWTRDNLYGWMIAPFMIFAIVWGVAFAIDSLSIDDRNRLDEAQHMGPIPAKVIPLSRDAYLLPAGVTVTPLDICYGGDAENTGAEETKRINALDATYVECYADQQWNAREGRINPGIFEAMHIAIMKSSFIWTGIIGLILTLIFPLIMAIRELIAITQERRAERKKAAQKKLDLEQARLELIRAYAMPEEEGGINHVRFSDGMNKLYEQGLPPAT